MLFVVGCGGEKKPDGMPALQKTTLAFVQDGSPLTDATITLVPLESENIRWPAGGTTDSQGVLQVKTMAKYDGVPAGKFKITVSKTETEGTFTPVESSDEGGARRPAATGNVKTYYLVDKKYRSADTTDLDLEIKSGTNAETFDVGKPVREQIPVYTD